MAETPVNTPAWASRYYLDNDALRRSALALQIGAGIADRIKSLEATEFLAKAEDWAEQQISEFIMVPLKPIRAPGQTKAAFKTAKDEGKLNRRNYPIDFIEAVIYRALDLMLHSEFFENQPNASESGKWAGEQAEKLILSFKDRCTFRVGAGHRRHPNPHMPPGIAPRQPQQPKM